MARTSQAIRNPLLQAGVVIAALLIWYAGIYSPLVQKVQELKDQLEIQQTKIFSLERRIRRARSAGSRIDQAEKMAKALVSRAVEGDTIQEVTSSLQNMILEEVEKVGARVTLYRPGRPRMFKGHQVAAVTFSLNCSSAQLLQLLRNLQEKRKIMRFKNLTISAMRGDPPRLRVNMEIEALFLGKEAG